MLCFIPENRKALPRLNFAMFTRSTSTLVLVLLLVLDVRAREPQQSPPARSTTENKKVRARDIGIPFEGTPGKFNSITDVAGVEVGYTTLISGEGELKVVEAPVPQAATRI